MVCGRNRRRHQPRGRRPRRRRRRSHGRRRQPRRAQAASLRKPGAIHLQPRRPPRSVRQPGRTGRRDPKTAGARPSGVAGLLINEVSVKGIVRNSSGFVALIQGPDNKTYVVKAGDRLMDGTVKSIVQDAVVFSQDVNDPLSLVKQKEIRKALRSPEGGRG